MTRPVSRIAAEIIQDLSEQAARRKGPATVQWFNLVPHAAPYLRAMLTLISAGDKYGADEGAEIIQRCLTNLGQYRGNKARDLKKELNYILGAERRKKR